MSTLAAEQLCLDHLKKLIQIPSSSGNENAIADFIESELVKLGIKCQSFSTCDSRRSILAKIPGLKNGRNLMFAAHIDTVVAVKEWHSDPLMPTIKNNPDLLYGLGSCDMKAGNAVLLTLASILTHRESPFPGDILFAFVPDEEAYSLGIHALEKSNLAVDFCIMTEPHYDTAIIGAPGKLLLKVVAHGKSCHGARPNEGINAIEELCRLIDSLKTYKAPEVDGFNQQQFVTLSMHGGAAEYSLVVPDNAEAIISKQLVPGEDENTIKAFLKNLTANEKYDATFDITVIPPYYNPYKIDVTRDVKLLQSAFTRITGKKLELGIGKSVSDGNVLASEMAIPTVMFGPRGGNMHSADEHVSISSMNNVLQVCLDFMEHYWGE